MSRSAALVATRRHPSLLPSLPTWYLFLSICTGQRWAKIWLKVKFQVLLHRFTKWPNLAVQLFMFTRTTTQSLSRRLASSPKGGKNLRKKKENRIQNVHIQSSDTVRVHDEKKENGKENCEDERVKGVVGSSLHRVRSSSLM